MSIPIRHHEDGRDCRGVLLKPGQTVVRAGGSNRLMEDEIKALVRPGKPAWWLNVHCTSGFVTTPDRVAVVQ